MALAAPILCGGLARQPDAPSACMRAASVAARSTGVPLAVLRAIALTETGTTRAGGFRPWPWTVNREGKGFWFDSAAEAIAFARSTAAEGMTRFDVGCFQLNYRWHGGGFGSIAAMFDPAANALYAARFLRSLYDETGSWTRAAGLYHSRSPALAAEYRARFEGLLAAEGAAGTLPASSTPGPSAIAPPPRRHRGALPPATIAAAGLPVASLPAADYPLLRGRGTRVLGSLVAAGGAGPSLIALGPQG